jgi:hypothetical protein
MCGKTPKPPSIREIPKPPAPAESAVRVRETAEATTQAQAGASRQTMRRFDVRLPANFNIPR